MTKSSDKYKKLGNGRYECKVSVTERGNQNVLKWCGGVKRMSDDSILKRFLGRKWVGIEREGERNVNGLMK